MIDSSVLFLNDPLDPLHRFTPTPFQTTIRLDAKMIQVESNDPLLLPPDARRVPAPVLVAGSSFCWTLIRDPKAPGRLESPAQFAVSANVIAVFMGGACLIAVDLEESELVAFIGSQIDALQYHEFVLPVLYRLSETRCDATPDTECPAAY